MIVAAKDRVFFCIATSYIQKYRRKFDNSKRMTSAFVLSHHAEYYQRTLIVGSHEGGVIKTCLQCSMWEIKSDVFLVS